MRLITRVTSLDTSSMLLKNFPRSGFFNFGNKSNSGGLLSGLYGRGRTSHPYFSKISDTASEAWGRALSCQMRTPAANMADPFLVNLWTQNILQKLSIVCHCYSGPQRHSVCCCHSILVISHNHHELNFRLLASTFFQARRSCILPLRGLRFWLWFEISYPYSIYGNNSVQKQLTCLIAPQQFHCEPLPSCFLFFTQLRRNPLCTNFSLLRCLSHDSENRSTWHVCFMHSFFTWFASIFFEQGADGNHRVSSNVVTGHPLLGSSWMLTWTSQKRDAHDDTMPQSTTLSLQTSCRALWILVGFFPRKVSILMYDRWSLREIWLQSVSSSISRRRFAEQGPRNLPVCTQFSLLKSGSQLSPKSERLLHLTGHATAVCRTFEVTCVFVHVYKIQKFIIGDYAGNKQSTGCAQDGKKVTKCIANYKNYIYKFHYKSDVFLEPLKVARRTLMSLKRTQFDYSLFSTSIWGCYDFLVSYCLTRLTPDMRPCIQQTSLSPDYRIITVASKGPQLYWEPGVHKFSKNLGTPSKL